MLPYFGKDTGIDRLRKNLSRLILLRKEGFRVFSGTSNLLLAKEIAGQLNGLSPVIIKNFSDGEIWVKYRDSLRGKDVFIIQTTNSAEAILELLILLNAAKEAKAGRRVAVIPYFGYARQDVKDAPRVAMSAKLMCRLIEEAGATHVILAELHNQGITNAFRDAAFDHLYLTQKLWPFFKKIPDLTVMSTDAGGAKMARYYARQLKAKRAAADKIRDGHNKVKEIKIIGDVKKRNVLIVDDIVDTCRTLIKVEESAKKEGAKDIYVALCTCSPVWKWIE